MKFADFYISKVIQESQTITSFYLVPRSGEKIKAQLPGQHIAIQVQPSVPGPMMVRYYTLSNVPGAPFYRFTVKKEPDGAVSAYLHEQAKVGLPIKASEPMGSFHLDTASSLPVVLVSAGVGITPMISMLEYISAYQPERKVYFFHSSRNKDVQPLVKRLAEIKKNGKVNMAIHHTQPNEQEILGVDYDYKGPVDISFLRANIPHSKQAVYYVCGPFLFMQHVFSLLRLLEVPESHIKYEFFGNPRQLGNEESQSPQSPHRILLAKSQISGLWTENHQSLLEFAESMGVPATSECRMGSCGTCETPLLHGDTRYDPEPFVEPQPGSILICCARPVSEVHLDL